MSRPKGSKNKSKPVVEPFNPSNLQKEFDAVNDPVSLDLLKGNPVFKQVVENIEFVKPEKLNPKGVAYNPYENPRFKSKNNLK